MQQGLEISVNVKGRFGIFVSFAARQKKARGSECREAKKDKNKKSGDSRTFK